MRTLSIDQFADVFSAIHGDAPFRWQERLAGEVCGAGRWPKVIAAPTGAGKTAVLDVALFHLALEADRGEMRRAPMRIVFAVDRRVIVDQAHERALTIRCALDRSQGAPGCGRKTCVCRRDPARAAEQAHAPIVRQVADALTTGFGCDRALHVEELRGGLPREDDWARAPNQPTILCTTVDQLGSRLLFRGYGVSPRMAPVHAGLLGEDALLILDEAHLSKAFEDTLGGVARWRAERGPRGSALAPRPWGVTVLTATPRTDVAEGKVFRLSEAERSQEAIARRLRGNDESKPFKPAQLVEAKEVAEAEAFALKLADLAREQARTLVESGRPDPVIAVIVNRVARARAVFELLRGRADNPLALVGAGASVAPAADTALLLTGRVRPVERDALIEAWKPVLETGGDGKGTRPRFVVATQCIEAGADFDFDALVTEIAPLDALRQRFGRLNRRGKKARAPAVIVAAKDQIAKSAKADPVYDIRAKTAWEWLSKHAKPGASKKDPAWVDFGPDALDAVIEADHAAADECISPARNAPVLRWADVEFFSITSPRPHPDPALSLFLRGELDIETDVSIVWRADIPAKLNERDGTQLDLLKAILAVSPPQPGEALAIPIWHARRWLAEDARAAAGQLPDAPASAPEDDRGPGVARPVLRWRGANDDGTEIIASGLRPGDAIVVPASYGGCDVYGWAPESEDPVADIAERANKPYEGRRAFLRLHPELWPRSASAGAEWSAVADLFGERDRRAGKQLAKDLLDALPKPTVAPDDDAADAERRYADVHKLIERLANAGAMRIERPYGGDEDEDETGAPRGVILFAPTGLPTVRDDRGGEAVTDEDDAGSFRAAPLSLKRHRADVEDKARAFAAAVGLPAPLVDTLALAGRLHDDGKADPRFQRYLRLAMEAGGGAERAPPSDGPFAKTSGSVPRGGADRALRRQASLPEHWRHEALSVRLAVERLKDRAPNGVDLDLALWLVGTHHGHGRPFFVHEDGWDVYGRNLFDAETDGQRDLPAAAGPERLDFDWCGLDWAELFATLKARYGVWGLAYLEAVLRLADHRASEEADRRANPARAEREGAA